MLNRVAGVTTIRTPLKTERPGRGTPGGPRAGAALHRKESEGMQDPCQCLDSGQCVLFSECGRVLKNGTRFAAPDRANVLIRLVGDAGASIASPIVGIGPYGECLQNMTYRPRPTSFPNRPPCPWFPRPCVCIHCPQSPDTRPWDMTHKLKPTGDAHRDRLVAARLDIHSEREA